MSQAEYFVKGHFTNPFTKSCHSPPHRPSARGERICISTLPPEYAGSCPFRLCGATWQASHLLLFCLHPAPPWYAIHAGPSSATPGRAICLLSHTPACCHVPVPTNSHTGQRWPRFHNPGTRGLMIFFLTPFQGALWSLAFLLSFLLIR